MFTKAPQTLNTIALGAAQFFPRDCYPSYIHSQHKGLQFIQRGVILHNFALSLRSPWSYNTHDIAVQSYRSARSSTSQYKMISTEYPTKIVLTVWFAKQSRLLLKTLPATPLACAHA